MRAKPAPVSILLLAMSIPAHAHPSLCASTDAGAAVVARLYDGQTYAAPLDLSPYSTFNGGARTACGDVNADGQADLIVVPGAGAAAAVGIYNGRSGALLDQYIAFSAAFTGGAY